MLVRRANHLVVADIGSGFDVHRRTIHVFVRAHHDDDNDGTYDNHRSHNHLEHDYDGGTFVSR